MVTRETGIEALLQTPGVVGWFIQQGISPFSCYGAFPGTVGKLLALKRVEDVDGFLARLNGFLEAHSPARSDPMEDGHMP